MKQYVEQGLAAETGQTHRYLAKRKTKWFFIICGVLVLIWLLWDGDMRNSQIYMQILHWQRESYSAPEYIEPTHIMGVHTEDDTVLHAPVPIPKRRGAVRTSLKNVIQGTNARTVAPPTSLQDEKQMLGALVALEQLLSSLAAQAPSSSDTRTDVCDGIDLSIIKISTCIKPFDPGGYAYGGGGAVGGGGSSSSSGSGAAAPAAGGGGAAPAAGGGGPIIIIGGGGPAPPPVP